MQIPPPEALIASLAAELETVVSHTAGEPPIMVGIHSGGVWIAERLHRLLKLDTALGSIDISFYRDDFSRIGLNPEVKASHLPQDMEDREILLVDDVLQTGRTIRAAMNELFSYARPAKISLAVLVDRSGRELPIQPDFVGVHLDLGGDEHIKLTGPETLAFVVNERKRS
jgi:pyrimidine operon attenuation protein/uracil phosphoribosyltransferase